MSDNEVTNKHFCIGHRFYQHLSTPFYPLFLMHKLITLFCLLVICLQGAAQTPELVKDINQDIDPTSLVYDLLGSFQQLNGTTCFFGPMTGYMA